MFRARHARKVRDRRRTTEAAIALGLVLSTAVGAAACASDGSAQVADRRERQAREAAAEAGLAPEVQALLGRAARAADARFSGTFTSGTERVVVYQLPPRRRVDVLVGGVAREAYVTDGRTAARCERPDGGAWRCTEDSGGGPSRAPAAIGAFSPELVARTVEALEDAASVYDLDVHDLTVAGTATSCLRATPKVPAEGAVESRLCVAADGVPLLLDLGDGSPVLRATAYRPTVDADDVRRPDA